MSQFSNLIELGKNIKTRRQLEIKFSIQLTSVFNNEQKAVTRKEYLVLVTMNQEATGASELNTVDSWNKASLGMLARLPSGRRDIIGSMDGKHGEVSVEYVQGLTNEFAR